MSENVNLLKISDLGDGHIQVLWQRGNEIIQYQHSIPFADPLSMEDKNELRWYLEEYLQFPYGAEEYRAEKLEQRMAEWGETLFNQVFIKSEQDPDPRGFYQEAVREGLMHCELCISSEDPVFLNIPWELIRDPTPGRGYLASSLGGLYRQRVGRKIEISSDIDHEGVFRILLVIARPFGEKDIPLSTVARPVLDAIKPFKSNIDLEVLRPPTFEALERKLNERPGFYNLVHFDGHGVFERTFEGSIPHYGIKAQKGHLVFEKMDGTEHIVNSNDLGQILVRSKVPLFVLNACQSAEEGKDDPYSSVASQLIAIGARGVVAMSYSVYATTAALFMKRFYESLMNRQSLSDAVAAGRRTLQTNIHRESVIGPKELQDWIVPCLYQQEYQYFPFPKEISKSAEKEDENLEKHVEEVCPEGRFGFIGRDYDILRIERALVDDNKPWLLITGMGGAGKTSLAYGFARWYAETGGCQHVFTASFKEKGDFGQVIGSLIGHGTDFSRLSEEVQWQALISFFQDNPCLLVWDNFETVAGYPTEADALAIEEEQQKLSRFLKALKGGRSRVIITTRKYNEDWLDIATTPIELGGLNHRDSAQLAKAVLTSTGKSPDEFKNDPEYSELITLLNGHPRSFEVVLPVLKTKSPHQVIAAIHHRVDSLGEELEDASLSLAFSQMSSRTKKHFPFIGLFASVVNARLLGIFVGPDGGGHQAYKDVMGEALETEDWESVLEEMGRNGLLRPKGIGIYELHPTLAPFLRKQLVTRLGNDGLEKLDNEFMQFYSVFAGQLDKNVTKGDGNAIFATAIEEANFLRAIRLALMDEKWLQVQSIYKLIYEFYEVRGRIAENNALRERLIHNVGRELQPDASLERISIWMFLLGIEANYEQQRNNLVEAESIHKKILNFLLSLGDSSVEPNMSTAYHQLGRIAEERQQFDQAEQWYKKALEIRERLGLERDAANEYHQLGRIAQERQQFDQAEQWYKKALEIFERLGHPPLKVNTLAQIGVLYRNQNKFFEAVSWFCEAFRISTQYKMQVSRQIVVDLARSMNAMGEDDFKSAWMKEFEGNEPLDIIKDVAKKLRE